MGCRKPSKCKTTTNLAKKTTPQKTEKPDKPMPNPDKNPKASKRWLQKMKPRWKKDRKNAVKGNRNVLNKFKDKFRRCNKEKDGSPASELRSGDSSQKQRLKCRKKAGREAEKEVVENASKKPIGFADPDAAKKDLPFNDANELKK